MNDLVFFNGALVPQNLLNDLVNFWNLPGIKQIICNVDETGNVCRTIAVRQDSNVGIREWFSVIKNYAVCLKNIASVNLNIPIAERNQQIKLWYKKGYNQCELSFMFGVSQPMISKIINS